MSRLISGKEALIALANGEEVEVNQGDYWLSCDHLKALQVERIIEDYYQFRLKPRTITINGIEVPAPFEPKKGDMYYRINPSDIGGLYYKKHSFSDDPFDRSCSEFGVWRTEDEIKQVVAALREVFKIAKD